MNLRTPGGVEFVRDQILASQRAAQVREEPRLDGADRDDLAVLGLVDVVVGNRAVEAGLAAYGQPAVGKEAGERLRHQGERTIHHRDVDKLPTPCLLASDQCGQNSNCSVHSAAGVIRDEIVRNRRQLPGTPENGKHTSGRDVVQVVAHEVAVRAVLSVASNRAVDDFRAADRERLVVDSQPLGDAGTILLYDHIGALRETKKDLPAGTALQVQRDRFLVAVKRVEWRPAEGSRGALRTGLAGLFGAAPGGSTRLFNLDDVGAQVAENHRAKWTRRKFREVEHLDSGKRRLRWHRDFSLFERLAPRRTTRVRALVYCVYPDRANTVRNQRACHAPHPSRVRNIYSTAARTRARRFASDLSPATICMPYQ